KKNRARDEFGVGRYDANGIIYEHDQYWNKTASIPKNTSVLLLSGGLDPQTPSYVAESLLRVLKGDNKELITFDYCPHSTLGTSGMIDEDPMSPTCAIEVLASYPQNNGDLKLMNKKCVDEMPLFNLTIPPSIMYSSMSTDDAYDGIYSSSLSAE
ncbi:hypothetical protein JG688_00001743, partial [Phytophthora aleatoria]